MTELSNGKPTKFPVEYHLKTLASDSTTKCTVDLIEGNEYRIQYTPTVRGRHEVSVTVKGQEVSGSPFPVFVSIHPTQLSKPVQVINASMFYFLALTPAGNIIAKQVSGDFISMLDKTGTKLMKSECCLYNPGSTLLYSTRYDRTDRVVVDINDGCVYVLSSRNPNQIVKLSPDLKLKQVFHAPIKPDNNTKIWYNSLLIVGTEVMVLCRDFDNNNRSRYWGQGYIMVWNKDLLHVRKIDLQLQVNGLDNAFQDYYGWCSDERGNFYIYVHDIIHDTGHVYTTKKRVIRVCVQVFSTDGEFLRLLDCGKDGIMRNNYYDSHFSCEQGVCVSGQYVYIINTQSVSVFTIDGEHMTTFECDESLRIRRVCVDKDGFVYLFSNCRLQIF